MEERRRQKLHKYTVYKVNEFSTFHLGFYMYTKRTRDFYIGKS